MRSQGVKVSTRAGQPAREYPGSGYTSVVDFIDAWTVPNQHDYLVVDERQGVAGVVSTSRLHSVTPGLAGMPPRGCGEVMRAEHAGRTGPTSRSTMRWSG